MHARPESDPERGELRADPFPRNEGQDSPGCGRVPHQTRPDPAAGRSVQAAQRPANECWHRRGQSPRGAGTQGISEEPGMNKPAPLFNRLALIGVGLIGSSIARAARAQGAARTIVATARSPRTRRRVAELGLADQVVETNAAAVEGADLVIVCIPVGACAAVAKEIGPHLADGAIVSD